MLLDESGLMLARNDAQRDALEGLRLRKVRCSLAADRLELLHQKLRADIHGGLVAAESDWAQTIAGVRPSLGWICELTAKAGRVRTLRTAAGFLRQLEENDIGTEMAQDDLCEFADGLIGV